LNKRVLPDEIGHPMSLLADYEIRAAMEQGYFLHENGYKPEQVRQASYEITLGSARTLNDVEIPHIGTLSSFSVENRDLSAFIADISGHDYLFINPLESCLIYSAESISLPDNVVGRINARGQLFQRGLIVESTYIDPGFDASVHLMIFNSSERFVKIPFGVPVARLEFMKLAEPVTNPHRGRQAIRQPETVSELPPWPELQKDRGEHLRLARAYRDKDRRTLAMDHLHLLSQEIHTQTTKDQRAFSEWQEKADDRYELMKVGVYCLLLAVIYLYAKSENFDIPLLGELVTKYPNLMVWLNNPITAIALLILTQSWRVFSSDFRRALSTQFGRYL
jgi:dCTP deaminase